MAAEIIKVRNTSYTKYEEVLLRRDNLRKEAEEYHLAFIREFGDLITRSFRLKIECIRKKKMIAYCQRLANRGKVINRNELTSFIEREMLEYQQELDDMIADVKAVKAARTISPAEVKQVKKRYYELVKLIHPDMHPELAGDETIKDYWQRIVIAYNYNNLKDLDELDTLVRKYLSENNIDVAETEIEDLAIKIADVEKEIEEIISTNPYLYRLILNDEREITARKQSYEDEIGSYRKYSGQLDEVLSTFEIREMLS